MSIRQISLCAFVLAIGITCRVRGHVITCESANAESEEDRLAREVEDPTAILTQLQIQDIYTPRNFQTSAQTNTIQIRPILPIEAFPAFPFQQIIRPTFKVSQIATSCNRLELAQSNGNRIWLGHWADFCVSDGKRSRGRKACLGVGTRSGGCISWHSAPDGGLHLPESHFVCVHEIFGDPADSNAVSAKDLLHARSWLVREIVGLDMDR